MRQRGTSELSRARSNLPGIAWPPMSAGPVAVFASYLRQLERSEWFTPDELRARQFQQLGILVRHAAEHSRQFRTRLKHAGLSPADAATPDGFPNLPPLTRRDIQTAKDALFCDALPDGHAPVTESRTSGSTGEPVVVKRTAITQLDWLAMTMREHLWHRRDFTGRLAAIRANISAYSELDDWGPPASLLFATGKSAGIPITLDVARQYELIAAFAPDNLIIYPSTLDALIDHMRARDAKLPSLRHIRTIGETLSPRIRQEAKEFFAARVADAYSSQEVGYMAIECPESGLYHTCETALVEIIRDDGTPAAEGEVGRIVVTDLHNFATPIIRYDIGDYAEVGGACACGRGLPMLARILGRERNLILMPDGSRYWPHTGGRHMRDIAPVSQFQLIQHDRERMEARLVVEKTLTPAQENAVRERIQKSLKHPFKIDLVYFDGRLPVGKNGKFEEFICKARPD
jgi:phenylacetate-CoA ligase